jgi:hypothetical protein
VSEDEVLRGPKREDEMEEWRKFHTVELHDL